MTHSEKWAAHAVLYIERFGLSVIPILDNKKPALPWKEFQERRATVRELMAWPKENLGVVTGAISNIVIVDCESREDAEWFWTRRSKTSVVVKTKRGYHLWFRHPGVLVANGTKIENRYDIRGDGGFALLPPSKHSAGCYTWTRPLIRTDQLPVFNLSWRPMVGSKSDLENEKRIRNGIAYIAKIRAVSGQGGHDETWRAVNCLKTSGLSEGEALLALQEWNRTNADPPWTDRELLHKLKGAYQ